MDKKRVNYSSEEKNLLTSLVHKYKDVVENKITNSASNQQKEKAWDVIATEFNSRGVNVTREVDSLRKQWVNIKHDIKKKAAKGKQELYRTGGGPPTNIIIDGPEELVLDVVSAKIISGMYNKFDGDRIITCNDLSTKPDAFQDDVEDVVIHEPQSSTSTTMTASNGNERITQEQDLGKTPKGKPNWAKKRRPKVCELSDIEKAKLEILQSQKQLVDEERQYKTTLYEMEVEHKHKLYKLELEIEKKNLTNCKICN
ncbi:hypothetical protein RI129_002907 [Pyrocoelia pectoralis]|uniref:Regulatory protein zeste n=1 Tax=Pyrocoelia pectoralis TaxID=417401 RepID=A0AAN7VGV5_9COLE